MNSALNKEICRYIASLHLKPGDRLPSIERIRRHVGGTQYQIYQEIKQIAAERKYLVIHGSGIYLPGRKKILKPFEHSVALISPGSLLNQTLIAALNTRLMQEVDELLTWIHSHRNTRVFVHEKFDMYFEAWRTAIRQNKPWIHFNLVWEDGYILQHEKLWRR